MRFVFLLALWVGCVVPAASSSVSSSRIPKSTSSSTKSAPETRLAEESAAQLPGPLPPPPPSTRHLTGYFRAADRPVVYANRLGQPTLEGLELDYAKRAANGYGWKDVRVKQLADFDSSCAVEHVCMTTPGLHESSPYIVLYINPTVTITLPE